MSTTIVNLTPHTVTVLDTSGLEEVKGKWIATGSPVKVLEIESSGTARAGQHEEKVGEFMGIPISLVQTGEVEVEWKSGQKTVFPSFEKDVFYVVSLLTAQALPLERRAAGDLFTVGRTVTDGSNRIVGTVGFNVVR